MKSDVDKLLNNHQQLTQSDFQKVVSHVQRTQGDWILNTLMIEGCDAPFRYQRKKPYKSLQGARVNLTYYPTQEQVAGMKIEVMKVVRIKVS